MKKNLFILFFPVVLVSLLMTILGTGCNEAESIKDNSAEIMSESSETLKNYNGWWYIDDDSHDGVSLIEIFYLDAEMETNTVYNNEGFPVTTLIASQGENGELILDLELFGEVPMVLLDSDTLICEDGMTFHRGEPLPEPDYSKFVGVWYEKGDKDGNYYMLSDDGSYKYYDVLLNEYSQTQEASESGTYIFSNVTRVISDSESIESLCLTMDDGSEFTTDDFYLLESGVGIMDSGFNKKFYIRNDALESTLGNDAISFCTLVLESPWDGDSGNYLSFMENGMFELSTADEEGVIKAYDGGTWLSKDEELLLVWNNGEEEIATYRVEDGIYIPSLKEVFTTMW